LAIGSLWLLYRYYRTRDPLFWFTTSSGVLLLWSWLVLSLAQGYYSMMLFPVPDDGGAAQFGDPQLAGVAGHLRIPDPWIAGCC